AERFYREAVRPILDDHLSGLIHSAARLGYGSDVLGYDTPRSMDHDWGPRAALFLSSSDEAAHGAAIVELLRQKLPHEFLGLPVDLVRSSPSANAVMTRVVDGPVQHGVSVLTVEQFCRRQLGFDP